MFRLTVEFYHELYVVLPQEADVACRSPDTTRLRRLDNAVAVRSGQADVGQGGTLVLLGGDNVVLATVGGGSKIAVIQRLGDSSITAFVEGHSKVVTGLVIPRRGTNHMTVIDRFITNGARLKLAKSIKVKSIV